MAKSVEAVFNAALSLPPEARAALAERLLESLDGEDQAGIDAAWAEEARGHLAAFDRGALRGMSAEEVMRSIRKE